MKITILGDIMCEPPVRKTYRQKDGSYNFDGLFANVKGLLSEADYVIGNLEAPLAGEDAKYTYEFYSFNAPDEIVDAMKKVGIRMVSTVNNHTFDRGLEGMKRTLRVMDEKGMGHTGTFFPGSDRKEAFYFQVDGTRFAVICYTYGTNVGRSKVLAEGELEGTANLLRHQKERAYLPGVGIPPSWIEKHLKFLRSEHKAQLRKWLGMTYSIPKADDNLTEDTMAPYTAKFRADIQAAKEKADVVIFYPHVGGQFNPEPGAVSVYVVDQAVDAGADAVIASHSHIVQKAKHINGIPCAYSLGNFSMSPNSALMVDEYIPWFGIMMHLYVEDKKIVKTTFSITKAVEKRGGKMKVWPVDELYAALTSQADKDQLLKDVRQIYTTVTGKEPEDDVIRREYDLTV